MNKAGIADLREEWPLGPNETSLRSQASPFDAETARWLAAHEADFGESRSVARRPPACHPSFKDGTPGTLGPTVSSQERAAARRAEEAHWGFEREQRSLSFTHNRADPPIHLRSRTIVFKRR